MTDKLVVNAHWSFWAIATVALIWNVMGSINFVWQMNADTLAALPESQRAMIEGRSAWATGAFAVAVFSGALGSLLLLLRKPQAYYFLIASFLAMVIKMAAYLNKAGSTIRLSPSELTMFILMPLVVAVFLIGYSRHAERKGWVS